jgi:hypothetical protein
MSQSPRVKNLTRNLHWKFRRAEKAVYECACDWVEYGVSVRDLTLAESIAARNVQAKNREPLAYAEIPGLVFNGPIPTDYSLIRAAHQLCAQ